MVNVTARLRHSAAAAFTVCAAAVAAAPVQDHILPFTFAFDRALRPLFDRKMVVSPANCGRMIRIHGERENDRDEVISVYCTDLPPPASNCYATLTRAARNLDYVAADHRRDRDP